MSTSLNTKITRDSVELRDGNDVLQWRIAYNAKASDARRWEVWSASRYDRGAWPTLEAARIDALVAAEDGS